MRKKALAATLACFFALSGTAIGAPPTPLPGANDAPGNSDCHTNGPNTPPGANGLCK
jgi:hypothetical protein